MSQLEPTLDLPLAAPPRRLAGRIRIPGWLAVLLRNPKSLTGLAMVAFMVLALCPYLGDSVLLINVLPLCSKSMTRV